MPTPNTISSLGDVDKISELENSTLTPTEIKTGIESGKVLGEKLAGLDANGDTIDAAIEKVNGAMTSQLDANTAKMNGVNKNDLDLIAMLYESGLTAQQIADAIKKSKDITMTAAQIDAAVSKVGLIQDVNSVISGLTATGAEIDNVIKNFDNKANLTYSKNMYDFNSITSGYFMGNTGMAVINNTYCYTGKILVVPGQTYVGNKDIRFTTYYDKNKIISSSVGSNNTITAGTPITIPNNVYYIVLTIYVSTYNFFQFELGNTPTNFEVYSPPYIKLTKLIQPLDTFMFTSSKNLFDKYNRLDGYFINWVTGEPQASALYSSSYFIPVLPNTSYIMSGNGGIKYLAWYNSSGVFISGNQSNSFPLTSPVNASFVRVSSLIGNVSTTQFEVGTVASGYSEPYILKEQYMLRQPTQWNGLKWASIGDSLTAGLSYQPYVITKHNVLNYNDGVGGTKISGSETTSFSNDARLNNLEPSIDIVSIMGGTNDWAQNIALGTINDNVVTTFMGALNVLINKLLTKYPSKRIFFITPPYGELYNFAVRGWSNAYTNTLGLTIKDYAEAIKLVCTKYNIPCLDLYSQCGWNSINIRSFITDDGGLLHPNALGGEKIGRLVSEFMDKL